MGGRKGRPRGVKAQLSVREAGTAHTVCTTGLPEPDPRPEVCEERTPVWMLPLPRLALGSPVLLRLGPLCWGPGLSPG